MSWINEIKLARWFNNGIPSAQAQGVNIIGKGADVVDNPNYQTTMPDGSIVTGRTEIAFYDPFQPLIWFAANAPAVAAERWISNYGSYFASNAHAKIQPRSWVIQAIRWASKGFTPAEAITLKLYHNGAAIGAAWQMVIPANAGPNYQQELRPVTPYVTGNGCVIGVSLTQAGASASVGMNAVISVS